MLHSSLTLVWGATTLEKLYNFLISRLITHRYLSGNMEAIFSNFFCYFAVTRSPDSVQIISDLEKSWNWRYLTPQQNTAGLTTEVKKMYLMSFVVYSNLSLAGQAFVCIRTPVFGLLSDVLLVLGIHLLHLYDEGNWHFFERHKENSTLSSVKIELIGTQKLYLSMTLKRKLETN